MKNYKYIIKIIIIGLFVLLINIFIIQICFVNGDSMNPTLRNGDIIIVKKFGLSIKHNDIAVIKKNGKIIIKRVIALPNDTIEINKYVYVNDKRVDDFQTEKENMNGKIKLKENEYFVLGDNRAHSIDSRFDEIGIIKKEEIIGIKIFNK